MSAGEVDFYAFKIGKLVTEDLPFEKAAENYLKDQKERGPAMQVDFAAPVGGGERPQMTLNERINQKLRGC